MTRAVLAGLALAAAAPAAAQTPAPAPARIAFVSFRDVLQRTPGYAAAESTFAREVESYRLEVVHLQQQMDSAVQAFDKQSIGLSPPARRSSELQQMQARISSAAGSCSSAPPNGRERPAHPGAGRLGHPGIQRR
jgi:Skp family chaperone for outer membrane proteins